MDTKLLKQKILDLAIRGKLVPQDPNDEPASVLLERIRAEKERLVAEGKIKRSKSTTDNRHYENLPFEVPNHWALSTLGELFYMHAGKSITADKISAAKDDKYLYPCIGGNGIRGYTLTYNTEGSFPIIGRQGALCGNINYAEGMFYATEHAVMVDTFCNTDTKWAYYFLTQLNLNQYATATAQPGLSVRTIGDVQIPIPPKEEQKRIVIEIEKWFALIDDLEQNKTDLRETIKQVKTKILDLAIHGKLVPQDLSDEPATELLKRIAPNAKPCDTSHYGNLPKSWCVVKLEEIYNHTAGKALKKTNTDGVLREYITTSNLYWNSFDFTEVRSMYFTNEELEKCTAHKGDLLLCNGGDVGRAAIWSFEDNVCFQNHISRLRPKYDNIVDNLFYCYMFMYLKQKGLLSGKGVAITSLSATDLLSILVPLPPLPEQKRITETIDKIFYLLDEITANL